MKNKMVKKIMLIAIVVMIVITSGLLMLTSRENGPISKTVESISKNPDNSIESPNSLTTEAKMGAKGIELQEFRDDMQDGMDEYDVSDVTLDIYSYLAKDDFVFGQYDGYREESDVEADSCTPTFAALRISINNWRWKGVPFYVRSGKHLAKKVTEVVVEFKNAPICVLDNEEACRRVKPNILTIRIQPDEGMRLRFCAKVPGREDEIDTANMFRGAINVICADGDANITVSEGV